MGIVNVNLPATDAWKELMKQRTSHNLKGVMGKDEENMNIEDVKLLYKLSEDGEYATLYDVYEEGMEIERGIVVPLSSTYKRTDTVQAGTKIVNVIGSSNDRIGTAVHKGNWIAIYRFITEEEADKCCTNGYVYQNYNNSVREEEVNGCNANSYDLFITKYKIEGGHVIIGKLSDGTEYTGAKYDTASKPKSDDVVAIMPICYAHNNWHHNDSYMIVGKNTLAVVLNYTLGRKVFKDYIK